MPRVTEAQIGFATLQILSVMPNGQATLRTIKRKIPDLIELSDEDRTQSITRPNEEMWEQQVRNLISHRTTEGNIFAEGYALYEEGVPLQITDAGHARLKSRGY
jgi:hypothetical protein